MRHEYAFGVYLTKGTVCQKFVFANAKTKIESSVVFIMCYTLHHQ
jgi:hypothetical protein